MSGVKRFRKKPVIVEALQWTGKNRGEIKEFCPGAEFNVSPFALVKECLIPTTEGRMIGSEGDWIIRGIKGEFYPCKPDIFEQTYEEVQP